MHTFGRTAYDAMQQNAQFSKSKVQCLLRHRGGNYYASAKVAGKVIRRSLETDDFNVAKNRLPAALVEMKGAKNATNAASLGIAIQVEAAREDPTIKVTTRHYYGQIAIALAKVAAKLSDNPLSKSISRVSLADLRALMDKFAASYSATRYNGGLALLRRTYDRAVEAGYVATNVPSGLKRLYPESQEYDLPTADELAKIVADILSQKKRYSKASAAAVEFMAYTGLRISEAQKIRWRNIKEEWLTTANAKNEDIRQVPLIPAALDLLSRLQLAGVATGPNDPVMLVKSPRIALDNSCERLNIQHMRIHDLRHIFATRSIEAGVDFKTLAEWLGHQDGGVLCAKVYGHLCKKHSSEMAKKVRA
jgi:integrase